MNRFLLFFFCKLGELTFNTANTKSFAQSTWQMTCKEHMDEFFYDLVDKLNPQRLLYFFDWFMI